MLSTLAIELNSLSSGFHSVLNKYVKRTDNGSKAPMQKKTIKFLNLRLKGERYMADIRSHTTISENIKGTPFLHLMVKSVFEVLRSNIIPPIKN